MIIKLKLYTTIPPRTTYIILRGKLRKDYLLYINIFKKYLTINCINVLRLNQTFIINRGVKNSYEKREDTSLLIWYSISGLKVRFSGKGYKLVKRLTRISLYLNTSHTQWLFLFKSFIVRIQKQKYLLIGTNSTSLWKIVKLLVNSRPLNIYTKRGLRLSRQEVFKKIGKRSS
jgi:hypothetical protein